jgi:tRNA threonylcarbamoyladenosine biosynthesis protein TsaE
MIDLEIHCESEMEALGGAIASASSGDVWIYLSGGLAAGKTTFARGFVRARGHVGAVKSPTFTLVESYELAGRLVHHFDLYRLADPEELDYIGLDEYFDSGADCLVEWPERGAGVLQVPDLDVSLEVVGSVRRVRLVARSGQGNKILEEIKIT